MLLPHDLGATTTSTVNVENAGFGIEGGENEGTVGYGTSVIEGANAGAAFATQSTGGAFTTTTQTTQVTGTAFGAEGAGFGIEGGDNEGTVGYGTSVIEGANAGAAFATQSTGAAFTTSTEGAGFGIEGGDNAGTVGYGTSVIQGATASSSVVGLPTVPSNNLVSTITPSFLPGPYISAVEENPVV